MPSMQSEISILNAEHYGLEPAHQAVITPATNDANTGGKRSAPSDRADGYEDEDDEAKKKRSRGRPRLDTKDETAADRRRTQIRLAQRAYRHRKDTAITTLEQRVKELEDANEAMSKEFSKFYDIILAERVLDIVPHAAPRLKSIADKLLHLASTASGGNGTTPSEGDEPTILAPPSDRRSTLNGSSDVGIQLSPANPGSQTSFVADREANTSSSYSSSLPGAQQQIHPVSYEVVAQATPNNASFPFYSMEPVQSQKQAFYLGHPIPNFSPFPRLASPSSYAFQERTFGRRLQRTTCERGLKLASMPNPPPERYAAVFGFCLLFEPRESIIRRLASGLRRTQSESLDTWKVPVTALEGDQFVFLENNFGSAGSDSTNQVLLPFGKSSEISGFPTIPPYGPQAQLASDDKIEQRIRMICQNFEGEFFTAEEVELFLRRLGINIPQHADYVEAEVDLNDLGGSEEAGLNLATTNVQSPFGMVTPGFGQVAPQGGVSNPMGNMWPLNASAPGTFGALPMGSTPLDSQTMNMGPMFGGPSDPNSGVGAYMNAQDFNQMWSTATNWSKTKVTVDVARLIEEMVSRSVCLGRTPGVRPKDVVRAIRVATGLIAAGA